jgi:hypothetical protein
LFSIRENCKSQLARTTFVDPQHQLHPEQIIAIVV